MTSVRSTLRDRLFSHRFTSSAMGLLPLILILASWLPTACTRYSPPAAQRDMAAERVMTHLRQTNAGLNRFKCVGKIVLSGPDRPTQSFRAAMAGRLTDHLRVDMFAHFGGSAGTFSSDGKHLFLVTPPTREYYKKRIGNGSLRRIVQVDVTVDDLLELLVGRIPVGKAVSARLTDDEADAQTHLDLVDRWGRIRQRVTLDVSSHPVRSVWFDVHHHPVQTVVLAGRQAIDGFVLPMRIDLSAKSGQRVSVELERYEANVPFDDDLFVLTPPPS